MSARTDEGDRAGRFPNTQAALQVRPLGPVVGTCSAPRPTSKGRRRISCANSCATGRVGAGISTLSFVALA
jgi:hypothetical protein